MPLKDPVMRAAYEKKYHEDRREAHNARVKKNREARLEDARAVSRIYSRTLKGRFSNLKTRSRQREIQIDLTFEEYCSLVNEAVCVYCKEKLPQVGSGLDRKNSTGQYSVENCVPCCTSCNLVRGADYISHEEMFKVIKLLRRLRRKNAA